METLRAALTAVEWPEDELSVFATLKGSLFAIPDETLFLYRHRHGRLYPFHKAEPAVSGSSMRRWRCWQSYIASAIIVLSRPR